MLQAMCSICMMDVRENEMARLDGTPHDICFDCFGSYLREEV